MRQLRPINQKATRIEEHVSNTSGGDVFALQQGGSVPHIPAGCTLVFFPGWEVDAAGGTAGLCQPVERDLYDCYLTCFWPAQVPDHLYNYPDWVGGCAAPTKDWRNIDLVFP